MSSMVSPFFQIFLYKYFFAVTSLVLSVILVCIVQLKIYQQGNLIVFEFSVPFVVFKNSVIKNLVKHFTGCALAVDFKAPFLGSREVTEVLWELFLLLLDDFYIKRLFIIMSSRDILIVDSKKLNLFANCLWVN